MPQITQQKNASARKWALIVFAIVITLGSGYLLLNGSWASQLISFFLYMSVSSTIIPLPTPPHVIALGKVFHPFIVAFVSALGSCTAALIEYWVVTWFFSKNTLQQKIESHQIFQFLNPYFLKSPFLWLLIAALTPIPLDPFRFTAILTKYNIPKYMIALFIGRFGCYYLIAWIGDVFVIPMSYIMILLVVLLVVPLIGIAINGIPFAEEFRASKPKQLPSPKHTI